MPDTTRIQGEEAIIQEFLAPLAAGYPGAFGLKDDCAVLTPAAGHDLIVKTDPIAAGVHFFPDDKPEDIAWKALAVNVSDLAAKAATPRAYVMALSFPEAPARDWMQRFAAGLAEAQRAFGMHLIGGDTDRRPGPVSITLTVFGEVPSGRMVQRGTAHAGDRLLCTGQLGDSALGLALIKDPSLTARWGLTAAETAHVKQRYWRPMPRLEARDVLRDVASAAMDLSDGLMKDCGRMCAASGVGARLATRDLALSPAAAKIVRAEPSRWQDVVAGGDDYEILFAVRPDRIARLVAEAAKRALPICAIGDVIPGSGVTITAPDGQPLVLDRTGWDHF
jgi:thiamine-monophosphate kinase